MTAMDASAGNASSALKRMAERLRRRDNLHLRAIFAGLGTAGLDLALIGLSVPALIPIPGPFGMVFGSCLAVLALQMMLGVRRLRLPGALARRKVPAAALGLALEKAVPWVQRAERFLERDRWGHLTGPTSRILIGLVVLMLAIALALPIPLGNVAPVVSISALAVALLERDGLALMVAVGLSLLALAWTGLLVMAGGHVVGWLASLVGLG